jgi:hypothetical protein
MARPLLLLLSALKQKLLFLLSCNLFNPVFLQKEITMPSKSKSKANQQQQVKREAASSGSVATSSTTSSANMIAMAPNSSSIVFGGVSSGNMQQQKQMVQVRMSNDFL